MKVILINGSSTITGTTGFVLNKLATILNDNEIETEILTVGPNPIRDCIGCWKCGELGKCIFDDDMVNAWADKIKDAEGIVFASPVYFAHASARIQAVLDRLFVSNSQIFHHKVGATICVARRAGTTATLDNLNKYMFDANMIAVGSSYWNMVFGRTADEATLDDEGSQTINNLALNIVYVLKCQEAGKSLGIKKPILDNTKNTNFIR